MNKPKILRREETLLLIVDIQDRLAAQMDEREQVVANTVRLIQAAEILKFPMFITEQYPKGLGGTVSESKSA